LFMPTTLIMPDTPLKRWRRQQDWTKAELARRIAVRVNTIARWERAEQCPRGEYLEKLLDLTGLPTDALVRPLRFLEAHPEFLADYGSLGPRRGRPRPPEPPSA
jgi:transcriptional regulator with XRE-family HTH domain